MREYLRVLTGLALALTLTLAAPALAEDEHNTVPGLTAAGAPLGLHGADPVALIESGEVVEGRAEHTGIHAGVAYYFASREHLSRFEARPDRYVPENGGFCTYGVAVGKKFDGDPRFAAVVDGKLYLFLNAEIFRAFERDRAGTIAKAEANWPQIRSVSAGDL